MTEVESVSRTIRPARPNEAEHLSALALRSKAYWGYASAFIEACRDELTYRAFQVEADHFQFAVAEVAGRCIGFYALERISSTEVELDALFVEPAYIGQGHGRALMEHAKREATRAGASTLVIQGDPHAESFYRAAGGRLQGWRASASIEGRSLPVFVIDLRQDTDT